jgi:mannosyltransferase
MIVFDNIVYSLQRSGGVSRFWSKITEHFLASAPFIERQDATQNLYRREQQHPARRLPDHRLPKPLARYLNFSISTKDQAHVFHSSYYRVNRAPGAINVTTVHDLIYERFGRGLASRVHIAQKRQSLAAADCIVCVSEHTRKDLHAFYPLTLDKRVLVIPNGVDPVTAPADAEVRTVVRQAAESERFFLYVGHRGSCKGFDRVYRALKLCEHTWRCIVVGAALEPQEQDEIAAAGLSSRIVAIGRVSDAELNYLYSRAGFFFFPSLYEGFGIPPLEAMQQGCPVLASNRSSIPEVVGEAGILFDPDDPASLEQGLAKVQAPATRAHLIKTGRQRAALFGWTAAANQYQALYADLLDGR